MTVQSQSVPFVSIVMPALNEEHYIAAAIRSILPADEAIDYELMVMDGGSTDRTGTIVEEMAAANPSIKLIHNPRRTQSAALNIATEICDQRATVIVRADCHALYPPGFVANCAASLASAKSASVVVSMRAIGRTSLQRAIAAAQNSRLGNGGSRHRRMSQSGYVEHGHHAAFDRQAFRTVGGYDETAPFNEDAEFDERLRRAGGLIYLDGRLTINYYPRTTFPSLARQYFRHGWGRANTMLKHAMRPKLRQLLPVAVLLTSALSLVAWPVLGVFALLPAASYVTASLLWGIAMAIRAGEPNLALAGPAAVTMHMSWATGFLTRMAQGTIAAIAARLGWTARSRDTPRVEQG